jgi:predicted site-specific integrase-resolvase
MATQQIDQFLPITDAASRYNIAPSVLHQLISAGKIHAAMLNGTLLISERDLMADLPKSERPEYKKYANLAMIGIGVREAARKYGVHPDTISGWYKSGYISKIGMQGVQKVLLSEADVAYCVEIYKQNPGPGKRIFNPDGTPYKHKS